MDSLSQVVLGASVGGAVMGRTLGRSALLSGALLGTLPDLDVLIDYGDAVANFTEHRGFSHSLLVLLPASLLLAWGAAALAPGDKCVALVGLHGFVSADAPVTGCLYHLRDPSVLAAGGSGGNQQYFHY